jgi:ABC-type Fe3+ transport system permease subunit/DNA-binding beta-propeller fold protein YncE
LNWPLLKNSLLVSGSATLLALSFGLIAALWLAGLGKRWRNLFLAAAILALALPPFLVTNCWLHFLGHTGVWHQWLPLNIISLSGTVWILSLLLWPIPLLAVLSAWRRLEPAQLESDMAVTGWALIRGLLLPLSRSALALAAVLAFVLALNNFAVPAILQVKVFPEEMWVRFNTAFDTAGALRLSLPLVVGPLLLVVVFARRQIPWPHLEAPVSARLFRQQLGPAWFWFCGAVTLLVCSLSVGLPLYQLLSAPRTWTELPGALLAGQSAIWNSVWFAAASATLILALGLCGARQSGVGARPLGCRNAQPQSIIRRFCSQKAALRRHRDRFLPSTAALPRWFAWLLWLPFLLPGVLLGIGLIAAFNRPWSSLFYQSAGIVILAFVIRYLALGWNTVAHASRAVDRDLIDVARLEGAGRWQMLRHAQWPQIAPQILAAWYILFLLCLWDVESMILVVPPGGETLALRTFNLLHYGHNAQVNALCLMLLVLALLPLLLWQAWSSVRSRGLSRFTFHVSRITHHASLLPLLSACALVLLTACSPVSTPNDAPLRSRLFSRVQIIGTRGVGVGQLNKPRSVAVDAQDNLYVVDMTGRVQKFSPSGAFLLSWQMPQTERGKPKGMGRDRAGNIIVVEPHYSRVNHFSPEGKLVSQWGGHGTNFGQLGLPRAVAVNSRGEIFISEYQENERVQKFTCEGSEKPKCVAVIGKPGTGPGEFNRPEGLAVDAQDRLYVADSCNHRIEVFSSDGKFLRAYGKPGSGKGELSYPYDICVDAAGRQYVCEFGNSRIQVFDSNDQPIEIIGGPGAEPGQFNNPWGVALDSAGNLYVADSQNHRVQKLIRTHSVASEPTVASSQWSVVSSSEPATDYRLLAADHVLVDRGPRTLDFGLWTLD